MHKSLAVALTLALALPAAGADTDARAREVAPFVDEQTFAVARLDLTRVDADALLDAFGTFGGIDDADAKSLSDSARRRLDGLTKAGVRDVYLVFSLVDDARDFPFVVVPLREGADANAIADLLDIKKQGGAKLDRFIVVGGSTDARDRLRSLKPAPRPELAKAFAAAGDGAGQLALIPPPYLARVIDEMMSQLPKEVGGGSSKVLTRGLKWAAVGFDAPPKAALRLTVQSTNADSARALSEALTRALKALGENKEVVAALPNFDKMAAVLVPKVEQDRVILTLEGGDVRTGLEPLVRRALVVAARGEASDRMKELTYGLHRYVDAHNRMPAVANFDRAGKPLLSWRVHVLPYIGEEKLYKEFHLDEPWDSDHNKKLVARMPAIFRGPSRKLNSEGKTAVLAPVGTDTAFTGKAEGRRFPKEFTDGTSNTILLILADDAHAVEWTRPEDLKIDLDKPHAGLSRQLGLFLFGMADGSVRLVKPTVSKETLRNAFTANDGQVLGADWD